MKGMMRASLLGFLGVVLLLMAACDLPSLTTVLATVGQQTITRQDVVYRIGIAKSYGNKQPMNEQALVYMIDDALTRQVAAKLGLVATKQDIDALSAYLDKHSKTPKILNAVKWVFGDNADDYRRIYVQPKVLNQQLQTWYAQHEAGEQRSQAELDAQVLQSTAGQGKTAFDAWFRQQAQGLPVHIADAGLRAGVRKKFPDLWWLASFR